MARWNRSTGNSTFDSIPRSSVQTKLAAFHATYSTILCHVTFSFEVFWSRIENREIKHNMMIIILYVPIVHFLYFLFLSINIYCGTGNVHWQFNPITRIQYTKCSPSLKIWRSVPNNCAVFYIRDIADLMTIFCSAKVTVRVQAIENILLKKELHWIFFVFVWIIWNISNIKLTAVTLALVTIYRCSGWICTGVPADVWCVTHARYLAICHEIYLFAYPSH